MYLFLSLVNIVLESQEWQTSGGSCEGLWNTSFSHQLF